MSSAKRKLATVAKLVSTSARTTKAPAALLTSYVKGRSEPKLRDITTSELVSEVADKYPDLNAVISHHQDARLTFAELDRMVSDVATNLYDHGYRRGDRIAVCGGNIWEYLVLQYALGRLGAVLVPLNPAFTAKQHLTALERTGAKGLVIQAYLPGAHKQPYFDTSPLIAEVVHKLPGISVFALKHHKLGQNESQQNHASRVWDAESLFEPSRHRNFLTSPDDIAHMQFTSGTTSEPKISSLTHNSVNNNGILIAAQLAFSGKDANHPVGQDHLCVPVPMFHCFGLVLSNLACAASGACVVLPSERFDPAQALAAVGAYDCTGLHGVPTMFAAELDLHEKIPKGGFEYLRTGIAAGSVVPPALMQRLINELGLTELIIGYGMTETAPITFMTRRDDEFDKKVFTVGQVFPHSECMIVRPQDKSLTPLPVGEKGEIMTAGYSLQRYYFQDREKTEKDMVFDRNGKRWMHTGDEGFLDSEGYLTVSGRIKDLIIRGGENINPQEIENVIFEIQGINQASVVGVPDEKYGEQVGAYIVLESGAQVSEEEIKAYVRQHLGHYLVPKYLWFKHSLPKTTSGKVRKVELRQWAKEAVENGK